MRAHSSPTLAPSPSGALASRSNRAWGMSLEHIALKLDTCLRLKAGRSPAMIGLFMPALRHLSKNLKKWELSKNNCVTIKSAPASIFFFRYPISSSNVFASGCFSGYPAQPIPKWGYFSRIKPTSSEACLNRMRNKNRCAFFRVSAQRHHIAKAAGVKPLQHIQYFGFGIAETCQMRHYLKIEYFPQ